MPKVESSGSKAEKGESLKTASAWNPRWPWSPTTAVIVTVILFLSQLVASFALLIYPLLRHWDHAQTSDWLSGSIAANFIFVVLAEGLTIWLLWLFIKRRKVTFRMLGWNRRPKWADFGKAVVVFVLYFIVFAVVLQIVTALIPSLNVDQKQELGFSAASGSWQLVLTFISLAVLPPLVEETVFRGFLFGSLLKKLTPIKAAVGTSILFGLAHLELGSGAPPLWTAAIDVFILSLGLCWLRFNTKSLWAGVFLHSLKNSVAFFVLFIVPMLHFSLW